MLYTAKAAQVQVPVIIFALQAQFIQAGQQHIDALAGKLGFNEKGNRIGDLYKVYEVDGNGGFVLQK